MQDGTLPWDPLNTVQGLPTCDPIQASSGWGHLWARPATGWQVERLQEQRSPHHQWSGPMSYTEKKAPLPVFMSGCLVQGRSPEKMVQTRECSDGTSAPTTSGSLSFSSWLDSPAFLHSCIFNTCQAHTSCGVCWVGIGSHRMYVRRNTTVGLVSVGMH